MKKQDFIKLTLDLYDLTGHFPGKEPLRYKIRGMGDDVLSDLLLLISNPGPGLQEKQKIKSRLTDSIGVLENLFEVAQPQDWVSPDDIEEMKEEYSRIRKAVKAVETSEVESEAETATEPEPEPKSKSEPDFTQEEEVKEEQDLVSDSISERQQRVVQEIEKQGPSQISDLKEEFPDVSRRTLIRDLNELTDKGLVNKAGKGPAVFYSLNK